MKVLIACEFSGIVREAFAKRGHDAWSCDLLPTELPGQHIQDDIRNVLRHGGEDWDLVIAHPPCTYLTVTGNKWYKPEYKNRFPNREQQRKEAILFFEFFTMLKTRKVCIENPVGIMSRIYRKPDQYIQPYQFGHPTTKKTCLWLKNLSLLKPTKIVKPEYFIAAGKKYSATAYMSKISLNYPDYLPHGKERSKLRSRTYQGIANAMAEQWK